MCIRFALLWGCGVHWYCVRFVMFDGREFVFLDWGVLGVVVVHGNLI